MLEEFCRQFTELKDNSARFESYQEVLKVPVTNDDVETLEVNLKLKRSMWQGLYFDEQVEAWKTAPLDELNPSRCR